MKLLLCVVLLCAGAAAARAAEPAPAAKSAPQKEELWRYFIEYNYFAPAESGQGLRDQLHLLGGNLVAAGTLDSSSTGVSTKGGSGTRVGVLRRWDRRTWLTGSIGYVLGPTMNANFQGFSALNGNGGLSVNRAAAYVTALLGTRLTLLESGPWTTGLDSEIGLGYGRVNQSCNSSGSLTCAGNVDTATKSWVGPAWGFALRESRTFELVELSAGLRYSGFPRFRGNDSIASIRWDAVGAFASAQF